MNPYNQKYIKIFKELADIYKILGDTYRSLAYTKAIQELVKYPEAIVDVNTVRGISGIGSGIMKKMDEINKTGGLKLLDELGKHPEVDIYRKMLKLNGFTHSKIKNLIRLSGVGGIKTFGDVREIIKKYNVELSGSQKLSLKYAEDIVNKIPRQEMTKIGNIVKRYAKKIDGSAVVEIVGSYRRGKRESKDVDVLIKTGRYNNGFLKKLVEEMKNKGIIVGVFLDGNKKFSGLVKVGKGMRVRHLDILYVKKSEWATALLHFTGSGIFNVLLRQKIKKDGYKLSEKGLYKDGKKIGGIEREEDIFKKLGMKYIPPKMRSII